MSEQTAQAERFFWLPNHAEVIEVSADEITGFDEINIVKVSTELAEKYATAKAEFEALKRQITAHKTAI